MSIQKWPREIVHRPESGTILAYALQIDSSDASMRLQRIYCKRLNLNMLNLISDIICKSPVQSVRHLEKPKDLDHFYKENLLDTSYFLRYRQLSRMYR